MCRGTCTSSTKAKPKHCAKSVPNSNVFGGTALRLQHGKVCNSLSIQVLVDTCAMRHLNYQRILDTTLYPSDGMQSRQTSCPALLITNLFRSHELNAQLTKNAMVLPQTVGFKAEAVGEEGIWCPCTVEDVSNDSVIISFDGSNAEWNRGICDPREIRNRMVPDRKRKKKGHKR